MTHLPRPRVLLAEGDAELRRHIARELFHDGSEVIEIADGAALLDLLAGTLRRDAAAPPFDVIVADVRLPGVQGGPAVSTMDVFCALRRIDWATPVIVLTASHEKFLYRRARQLGAVSVLQKPVDVDALRAAVARTCEPSRTPWRSRTLLRDASCVGPRID